MKNKEIQKVFEKLNLFKTNLPEYKNPYDFTKDMKRCDIPKEENIQYSSGTASLDRNKYA